MGLFQKSDLKGFVIPVLQLQFVQIPESPDKISPKRYRQCSHEGCLQARNRKFQQRLLSLSYSRYDQESTFWKDS